jgi:hypothetical protein
MGSTILERSKESCRRDDGIYRRQAALAEDRPGPWGRRSAHRHSREQGIGHLRFADIPMVFDIGISK